MIGLVLEGPLREVVCLGAHPDDIEIGSFGTLRLLAERYEDAVFTFVIATGDDRRRDEAETSLADMLGGRATLRIASFADNMLPYQAPADVKTFVRSAIEDTNPSLVLSPRWDDVHQDHAFMARLARQLFRDHVILEYEIGKYDADLSQPQAFVPLTPEAVKAKVEHLSRHFGSQHDKPWYDESSFRALMRLRGMESNSPSGYAEAFHVWKLWLRG